MDILLLALNFKTDEFFFKTSVKESCKMMPEDSGLLRKSDFNKTRAHDVYHILKHHQTISAIY